MAMLKCKECGAGVSSKAKGCPACGAPVAKPTSRFTWIVLWVIVGSTLVTCAALKRAPETAGVVAPKTPAQIKADQDETVRLTAAVAVMKTVKASARDPDSLQWESLRTNDNGAVVCAEYRARNGFGGMNREFLVLAGGKVSQQPAAWNKNCSGGLWDMLEVAKRLAR